MISTEKVAARPVPSAERLAGVYAPRSQDTDSRVPYPGFRFTPDESQPLLTTMEVQTHADSALRRHLLRASLRIGALLLTDVVTVMVLREFGRRVRDSGLGGPSVQGAALRVFPTGAIHTMQLCVALILSLVLVGAYKAGEAKRDLGKLMLAASLAASRQLWNPLWLLPLSIVGIHFVLLTLALAAALFVARGTLTAFVNRDARARIAAQRTLLVGSMEACVETNERYGAMGQRLFDVQGFVDLSDIPSEKSLGGLRSLDSILRRSLVDTILVCGDVTAAQFARIGRAATAAECQLLTPSDSVRGLGLQPMVERRDGMAFLHWRRPALRITQLLAKRAFDVVSSFLILLVAAPTMLLVAIAVRVTSDGPALFAQRRLGLHGHPFYCYKFRSMYIDAEERLLNEPELYTEYVESGFKLSEDRDTRITPLGRFLRKTSLDELPQLWNVLLGDMSLVGPRPIVPHEIENYADERLLLLSLKPGLTGAWQVQGRSNLAYPARADVELDYVSSWSFTRDVTILLQTIPAVLLRKGAY